MWRQLLHTDSTNTAALLLRITLGVVMFPHGAQKLFGWFGGNGFSGTIGYMTGSAGLPWIVAFLVILIESVGAVMLILGLLTRLAAAGIVAVMLGAIFTVHLQYGFFMNWSGQQAGEGFEYHLLAIGIALALLIRGGGKWSADAQLQQSVTKEYSTHR